MDLLLAGFYTPEYADLAQEWTIMAQSRHLPYRLIAMPDAGSWLANVNLKPLAIATLLASEPEGRSILWLDVDAEIQRLPAELPKGNLLAYLHTRPSGAKELCSGTLWLTNARETRDCVAAWHRRCVTSPWANDQHNLEGVYDYSAGHLDPRWCYMDGLEAKQPGVQQCKRDEAYIIHHQASRERRK
jgi:hypothetical protein